MSETTRGDHAAGTPAVHARAADEATGGGSGNGDAVGAPSVFVTGGTSGIGAATARMLAGQGWRVVVCGRDRTRGEHMAAELAAKGAHVRFVAGDLASSPDELRALAAQVLDAAGGRLDALVHCAAVCPPVDTLSLADADLDAALATNVRAPHVLTAALVPAMLHRGGGSVVVVGSWMAHVGSPFVGLYSATKAAELQLARSWAAEFGPAGVRVNAVTPGVTRAEGAALDDIAARMVGGAAAQRAGTPDEVARVIVWLLGPEASYVQGSEVRVDGGISSTRIW